MSLRRPSGGFTTAATPVKRARIVGGIEGNSKRILGGRPEAAPLVAQIFNLPCRRVALCAVSGNAAEFAGSTSFGIQFGDTAASISALRFVRAARVTPDPVKIKAEHDKRNQGEPVGPQPVPIGGRIKRIMRQ